MAKIKLRIITDRYNNEPCSHFFLKNQVVFTNNIDSIGDTHAKHSKMCQVLSETDYVAVEPIKTGDVVISRVEKKCVSVDKQEIFNTGTIYTILSHLNDIMYVCSVKDDDGTSYITTFHRNEFFAKWDRVILREDSKYADGKSSSNPLNTGGTIYNVWKDDILSIGVIWDNNTQNSYHVYDLDEENEDGEEVKVAEEIVEAHEDKPIKYKPKIGDTVKISNKSIHFKDTSSLNPKCKGSIVDITGPFYSVNWENHSCNVYSHDDLVVLKKAK